MGDLSQSGPWKKTFIVPAIKSFDHYDFNKAKIRASLTWLVTKAFGTGRWRPFLWLNIFSFLLFFCLIIFTGEIIYYNRSRKDR